MVTESVSGAQKDSERQCFWYDRLLLLLLLLNDNAPFYTSVCLP